MSDTDPILELQSVSHSFGPGVARQKLGWLDCIRDLPRVGARQLGVLHDTLCFMRAYPDDSSILAAVAAMGDHLRAWHREGMLADTGFPGGVNYHSFSYPVLLRMQECFPGCTEVDWDELEDQSALHNALVLFVQNNECQGLDDTSTTFPEWCERSKPDPAMSDLGFLLHLFHSSDLSLERQAYIFEACGLPIQYSLDVPGTGRCEQAWPRDRIAYQRKPIEKKGVALQREIHRPFEERGGSGDGVRLARVADGRELVRLALAALCSRNLEISSLIYANPEDVTLLECARGLQVLLIGVHPGYRDALEITYFCGVLKNGVPIAYGPASVCLGCCEMGINLFPEFRGGEIRYIYSQFMRALHQVFGVRYFYVQPYGMGQGNPEAIRTGAFWFYRKLGFRPTNPAVETLAQEEEAKMRVDPRHRSPRQMLRRLSYTRVYFDISDGECRPLDLGAVGVRHSRMVGTEFGGDRNRADAGCVRSVVRSLGCGDHRTWEAQQQRALRIFAPVLHMLPELPKWSAKDKRQMIRILKTKGGRSECGVDRLLFAHRAFRDGLRRLARRE